MIARLLLTALFSALLIGLAPDKTTPVNLNKSETAKATTVTTAANEINHAPGKAGASQVQQVTQPPKSTEPEKPQTQAKVAVQETNTPEAWMNAVGIPEHEKASVDYIMKQESIDWCPTRWQGEHGPCPAFHGVPEDVNTGYGLCQSTPASKMASAGADWQTNPVTQLKWCTEHMQGYGSWTKAAEFKRCTGWCYSTKIARTVFKATPYW